MCDMRAKQKKRIFIHLFSDRINVVTHTHSYTYVCLRIDIIIKKTSAGKQTHNKLFTAKVFSLQSVFHLLR